MLINEEEILFLTRIGLTKTQAKIYLTLFNNGNTGASKLADMANIPRPLVYRTLHELQNIGVVEKRINTPHRFVATPPDLAFQILVHNKFQQFKEIQKETKLFLRKIDRNKPLLPQEHDHNIKVVSGRRRILQIIKSQHKNVQRSVYITTTLQRFHNILDCCSEECEKALQRNVKYQIIIEKNEEAALMTENLRVLLRYSNFRLKLSCKPLGNNMAIFDSAEATFNSFPSKPLNESPIFWTNNPIFILMAQDHFDKVWKSARKCTLEDN